MNFWKNKKWALPLTILYVIVVTVLLFLQSRQNYSATVNHPFLAWANGITNEGVFGQVILGAVFYICGYSFLLMVRKQKQSIDCLFLSYPVGILLWSVWGILLIVLGIPFNRITMACGLGALLIFCIYKNGIGAYKGLFWMGLVIYAGIAAMAGIGLFPLTMTSDSNNYLRQFGAMLVKEQGMSAEANVLLTWVGICPAVIAASICFGKLHSLVAIQYCMFFSMIGFIGYVIGKNSRFEKDRMKLFAGLFSAILICTVPAVIFMGTYAISNSYVMFFMVFFCIFLMDMKGKKFSLGEKLLLGGYSIVLSTLRIEGMMLLCLVLVVGVIYLQLEKRSILLYSLLPTGIMHILYWIQVYRTGGNILSAEMSVKTFVVLGMSWILSMVYVLWGDSWMKGILGQNRLAKLVLPALIIAICILGGLNTDRMGNILVTTACNISNLSWGPAPWIMLVGAMAALIGGRAPGFLDTTWMSYILLYIAIYGGSRGVRIGEGDSLNRNLYSIVPLALLAISIRIWQWKGEQSDELVEQRVEKD